MTSVATILAESRGPRLLRAHNRLAFWIAVLVAAVAAAVLVFGWGLGIDRMTRLLPGFPAMVMPTAASLLVGALGTIAVATDAPPPVAAGCGILVAVTVALGQWSSSGFTTDASGDAMSMATQLACMVLALSLVAQGLRNVRWLGPVCDTLGLALCGVPLVGYLLTGHPLFGTTFFAAMALHTALALFLLFFALLLLRPEHGWTRVLLAPEAGSKLARRLLPVHATLILGLCAAAYHFQLGNGVDLALLVSILAFTLIALSCLAQIYYASRVNLSERRAAEAERAYRDSEKQRMVDKIDDLRRQRTESLGQLVDGVAHDFNNLLEIITSNLDIIALEKDQSRIDAHIKSARKAAGEAARLTSKLLNYAGTAPLDAVRAAPDRLIGDALEMFRRVCPPNISIDVDLRAGSAEASIDPAVFQQALLNVLNNARDAMSSGGVLRVASAVEEFRADERTANDDAAPDVGRDGTYVTISIGDTGTGMSAEARARATEPFFTTKDAGMGSGLGLSMARSFSEQSGGAMTIESEPGTGTEVTFWFPAVGHATAIPAPEPARTAAVPSTKTRILFVDDHPEVSHVLARKLERMGFDVIIATDGEDALSLLTTGINPDLVISDVAMPGRVQGDMLAAGIGELYPDLPIIVISGRAPRSSQFFDAKGRPIPFLGKPIDVSALRTAIHEALGDRKS
ncbi:ATP-binding protein [Sulfitobacter sp. D35]|uniref:ATP-binding protein n=1 Tax=Sulfitobacter sp. D35 TaxID=3083252 RepID=UPI00296EF1AD|nr:ATP-binding protein [Sulfitobacter sp. D35]MDW4499822.1 ATP-binding protein [Sulfitobacter sp. D35]